MHKQWIHRGIEAMKEAAADDREVALALEEHPGVVGLGIHLENTLDRLGMLFFPLRFSLWDLHYCAR